MYSEKIMEEFLNPKNSGVIKGASGVGKITLDVGSEIIKIFIKVEENKIVDCQFQTFGGVVAIALSSMATSLMIGSSLAKVRKLTNADLLAISGEIPDGKSYLVDAVISALKKSVENYEKKDSKNGSKDDED